MSLQVTVLPARLQFAIETDETVLAAALRQGIDFPHRCTQGVCTSCVCRLESGQVHYAVPAPAPLAGGAANYTYCCLAYADTDLVLHHPFIRG